MSMLKKKLKQNRREKVQYARQKKQTQVNSLIRGMESHSLIQGIFTKQLFCARYC